MQKARHCSCSKSCLLPYQEKLPYGESEKGALRNSQVAAMLLERHLQDDLAVWQGVEGYKI